jgi:hypothetical protein
VLPLSIFSSCPGDLNAERQVVADVIGELHADLACAGRVRLVPYAYANAVPVCSGMDAQEALTSSMLRPEAADLSTCLLWRRLGTPMVHIIDPKTNQPYFLRTVTGV